MRYSSIGKPFPGRKIAKAFAMLGVFWLLAAIAVLIGFATPTQGLMFAAIMLITIASICILLIAFNTYAVIDWHTRSISIKGGTWYPFESFTHIDYHIYTYMTTMSIGINKKEKFYISKYYFGETKEEIATAKMLLSLLPALQGKYVPNNKFFD